jgi:hypothetical protein
MKIFKEANKAKVTREIISKFGETVYRTPDVEKVFIKVSFNDGSAISFRREQLEDEFDNLMNGEGVE